MTASQLTNTGSQICESPMRSNTRKRVLSTSRDSAVLTTRNLLIQSAGYDVLTTRDPETFLRLVHEENFDAVVIGDSIPLDARADLARRVRFEKPDLPIVVFVRTLGEAQMFEPYHVVQALGETDEFLKTLHAAVRGA